MAPFLLLAALLLPQGSRAPVPVGPVVHELSADALLERIRERRLPRDERMACLEELASRGLSLELKTVQSIRNAVRGEWLVDYVRCLSCCGPAALPDLQQMLSRRDPEVKAEAVYAITSLDAGNGELFARQILADLRQPVEIHVAALRGLDARRSVFARMEALRRLPTAGGALLIECLQVLRRNPRLEDAPYLVELLHQREGRPANEAVRLLQQLTGYKIGRDPRAWRYWLLHHRGEGTDFHTAAADGGQMEEETVSYHGIPILGEKVVFVLDSSGSMDTPLPEHNGLTRGARAVQELIGLLPRLPEGAEFDLIFFDSTATSFGRKLVPRDDDNLEDALDWLQHHRFTGGTNLHDGLKLAFEREGVEEIFLLSDGEPTAGELVDPSRIAARVRRWNRWRNIRVNTISFGAPPAARDFLYQLARDHDGVCRVIW